MHLLFSERHSRDSVVVGVTAAIDSNAKRAIGSLRRKRKFIAMRIRH